MSTAVVTEAMLDVQVGPVAAAVTFVPSSSSPVPDVGMGDMSDDDDDRMGATGIDGGGGVGIEPNADAVVKDGSDESDEKDDESDEKEDEKEEDEW